MKKQILLIEDNLLAIDIYNTALKEADFEVETITTGEDAIKRIKKIKSNEKKPDLVLLDLILPDINGINVLEEIRKQEETKGILVFILTNYTDEKLKKMGERLAVDKYLLKTDYTPSRLVEVIKKSLIK